MASQQECIDPLRQLLQRWRDDESETYRTWFLWEEPSVIEAIARAMRSPPAMPAML